MLNLSFLLDTNVIIQFEEVGPDNQIKNSFQKLHFLLAQYQLSFKYHPLTENELYNDKNEGRLEEMISRLKKYPQLQNPPLQEGLDLEDKFGGIDSKNDLIDCQLLFAISRNCATYLVTEDKGIHKRADNAKMGDRVLFVSDTIDLITKHFVPTQVQLPNVAEEHLYNLELNDPLFEALKEEYPEFEDWIKRNSNRSCWTIRVGGNLAGLCIYKHDGNLKEEYEGIKAPSIKICTFKVSDNFQGRKFGELLLKNIFHYAVKNDIASIWVTTYEKQDRLIQFLRQFGFSVHKEWKEEEMIFFKLMSPPKDLPETDPLNYHIRYSPNYYDDKKIKKFVIPIKPEFHNILFPEVANLEGPHTNQALIPGNTIRKVYICHSNIRVENIPLGSLIFFYITRPKQYVQTLGIVEKVRRLNNMDSLATAIGRRSVYSLEVIKKMIKKEVLVIDFRLIGHSKEPIVLFDLLEKNRVFNNMPPQSIAKLDHSKYLELKKLWNKKKS